MIRQQETDRTLVISTVFLLIAGVVITYAMSGTLTMGSGNSHVLFTRHLVNALVGLASFIIASNVPYGIYRRLAYPILTLAVILFVCIYVPGIGFIEDGKRRWATFGPLAFQPSEFAKFALIVFLAYSLSSGTEETKDSSLRFLPAVIIPGVLIWLIMLVEPDVGALMIALLTVIFMYLAAGTRLKNLTMFLLMSVPAIYLIVQKFIYMTNTAAVVPLLTSSDDLGVTIRGVSLKRLLDLPATFMFAKPGLMAICLVIFLYMVFLYCGINTAKKARDWHGKYLALGFTSMVAIQVVINIVAIIRLSPVDVPLSFINHDGTSLVTNMVAAGIIRNIGIQERSSYKIKSEEPLENDC